MLQLFRRKGERLVAWFVYMLRCRDGSLYTGCTDQVARRLATHQSGKGAKYTRSRLPVELVYQEEAADRSAALRREAAIKRLTRKEKLELIKRKEGNHMVEMRRKDRQMSEEFAWQVVDQCEYAFLAMTAEDGTPYGVVVNVFRDGTDVYFHCAMEGRKTECMRKNPKVCLTCVSHAEVVPEKLATLYSSAIAFGTAEEILDPAEKVRLLHLLCERYEVPTGHASVKMEFAGCGPKTAIWRIRVDAITGKARQK